MDSRSSETVRRERRDLKVFCEDPQSLNEVMKEVERASRAAGMDGHLCKPLNIVELQGVLDRHLG